MYFYFSHERKEVEEFKRKETSLAYDKESVGFSVLTALHETKEQVQLNISFICKTVTMETTTGEKSTTIFIMTIFDFYR